METYRARPGRVSRDYKSSTVCLYRFLEKEKLSKEAYYTTNKTTIMARTVRNQYKEAEGADGEQLPRYFGKSGHSDADPTKIKKDGHGRGNWGKADDTEYLGDEFNFHHTRRRSNSSGNHPELNPRITRAEGEEEVFEEEE
ncbi:hypothetical protein TRVA0_047S00738 [Trichomonascus vanleenenianus]|uniref:uncharacterized protein n=1 Tax=Trichomonascus vanleenenianus TaxID=2268995 RepID=UPI003ECB5F48